MNAVILDGDRALYKGVKSPQGVDLLAACKFGDGSISFGRETLAWIKPIRVGICGTDLAILDGTHGSTQAVILGHEVVGVVEEVGAQVRHVKEGDRVAVDPNVPCGVCEECRRGAKNRCLDLTTAGIFFDGGMAEVMVIPARQLIPIPSDMPWDVSVLFEPLSCVMHGIARMPNVFGGNVLIFGAGPIGALWMMALKALGVSSVTVVETSVSRVALAGRFGADAIAVSGTAPMLKDSSYDIVVDAAGHPSVVPLMIKYARNGAVLNLFGQQHAGATVDAFPIVEANQKELTIVGSYATAYEYDSTIAMLEKDIPFFALVTHRFELKDAEHAFKLMRKGVCMKALFLPNGEDS